MLNKTYKIMILSHEQELKRKAYRIIAELMNEDCFEFEDVHGMNFDECKNYLHDKIIEYFSYGETNLAGLLSRSDANVNNFINDNKELINIVITLMDENQYFKLEEEFNLR